MEGSQDFQRQLYQYRSLQEQRDFFQAQLDILNNFLANLNTTKTLLENLKGDIKEDEEILVPIGGLINIKAKIKDINKILVNIGQDVVVEKNIDDSIAFIQKLIEKNEESRKVVLSRVQMLENALIGMSEMLQKNLTQGPK